MKSRLRENETALHGKIEEMRVLIEPVEKDLEMAEQEEKRLQEAEANAQRIFANTERLHGQAQLNRCASRRRWRTCTRKSRMTLAGDVRLRGGCFWSRAFAVGWHG